MALIVQETLVNCIEILRSGTLQVRFSKIIKRDDAIISEQYHRTVFPPGIDIDEQMKMVNKHLTDMGEATVKDEEIQRIKRIAAVEHTLEVIAAYKATLPPEEAR